MKQVISILAFSLATLSAAAGEAPAAGASPRAAQPGKNTDVRVMLAGKLPGAKPEDVHPTPVSGLYEISLGGSTGYITVDGKYIVIGELYEIASKTNITEERRTALRTKELAGIKDLDAIVFAPTGPTKYSVDVFTDVDCPYCRKLHSEMAEYNKLGVRVRYLAYPRSGPGTASWAKMEAIWCSKDRQQAMTRAKQGEVVPQSKCATPVSGQYELGTRLGVNGTPAIITADGDYIGGYMPPAKLVEHLEELKQAALANKAAVKAVAE